MTAFKGLGTYGNGVGVVTPSDHKQADAGLIVKQSGNLVRAGLFWGGTGTIITGTAGMAYNVAAYPCATTRGSTSGVVLGGNDGTLSVSTTAAPGSNSRWDVIYHWHREYSLDGTDSNPVIGVVQGTAAATPTVPSLSAFPGAIELGRVLVPAGVTATSTGTTISQTAPFTAAAGGVVVLRNSTERDAFAAPDGTIGYLLDLKQYTFRANGVWSSSLPLSHAEFSFNRSAIGDGATNLFSTIADATNTNDSSIATISGGTGNTLTIPTAGLYELNIAAAVAAASTGPFGFSATAPGVNLINAFVPSGTNQLSDSSGIVHLAAAAVITIIITKNTGGAADITSKVRITRLGAF